MPFFTFLSARADKTRTGSKADEPPQAEATSANVLQRRSAYRKHAQDARDLAGRQEREDARCLLDEIAGHWDALADLHERLGLAKAERS